MPHPAMFVSFMIDFNSIRFHQGIGLRHISWVRCVIPTLVLVVLVLSGVHNDDVVQTSVPYRDAILQDLRSDSACDWPDFQACGSPMCPTFRHSAQPAQPVQRLHILTSQVLFSSFISPLPFKRITMRPIWLYQEACFSGGDGC
jgi:hypothetical protein